MSKNLVNWRLDSGIDLFQENKSKKRNFNYFPANFYLFELFSALILFVNDNLELTGDCVDCGQITNCVVRGHFTHKLVVREHSVPSHWLIMLDRLSSNRQLTIYFFQFNGFSIENINLKNTNPIRRTKIHGLGKIEALVKAGVIGTWESYHKFARVLIHFINLFINTIKTDKKIDQDNCVKLTNRYTVSFQDFRVHYGDQMVQQIGRVFKKFFRVLSHNLFELFGIVARHSIPSLCISPVQVIYRVAPVVFYMPTKARKAHSNVSPWYLSCCQKKIFFRKINFWDLFYRNFKKFRQMPNSFMVLI